MTQQGWTDILYALQSGLSFQVWIYFVILNFIGPYFVIQLFLVVISKKYAEIKEEAAATQEGNAAVSNDVSANNNGSALPSGRVHPDPDADGAGAGENGTDLKEQPRRGSQTGEMFRRLSDASKMLQGSRSSRFRSGSAIRAALRKVRSQFQVAAASSVLDYVVMGAIVCNTVLMAINSDCDFCGWAPCAMEQAVMELSNVVFTAIFTLESLIKFIGYGPQRYLWVMAPMTWLDIGIVASSLAETPSVLTTGRCYLRSMPCADYDDCESGGGTSVLRIVRLLRVLKLLSRFPSFQKQVSAIAKTAKSVYSLVFLILVFIVIFLILGTNTMAGLITQPWSAGNLVRGMRVFVRVPGDDLGVLTFAVQGRVATLQEQDLVNHSSRPW